MAHELLRPDRERHHQRDRSVRDRRNPQFAHTADHAPRRAHRSSGLFDVRIPRWDLGDGRDQRHPLRRDPGRATRGRRPGGPGNGWMGLRDPTSECQTRWVTQPFGGDVVGVCGCRLATRLRHAVCRCHPLTGGVHLCELFDGDAKRAEPRSSVYRGWHHRGAHADLGGDDRHPRGRPLWIGCGVHRLRQHHDDRVGNQSRAGRRRDRCGPGGRDLFRRADPSRERDHARA